ncbi:MULTISPECIES: hypothetical protein [Agrobacterium]|uniref:hypothetical protein n=1 Tax=Agrobacterium TaxID=357 RepID=UPI001FD99E98|nr:MULTISPECIES: hypothetical protein [Agrobacterium]
MTGDDGLSADASKTVHKFAFGKRPDRIKLETWRKAIEQALKSPALGGKGRTIKDCHLASLISDDRESLQMKKKLHSGPSAYLLGKPSQRWANEKNTHFSQKNPSEVINDENGNFSTNQRVNTDLQ